MMDSRSFFLYVLIATAGLDTLSLVEGYVAGAPPESCDTMLPIHSGNGFDDCSVAKLCPTVSIDGVEIIDNTFQYNCSQNYTIIMSGGTSSLRGFLVEFRNFSDSPTFDGNLSHVGEFVIRSGYEDSTRLECEGHGVTQSKINTAGTTSFIWISPGIGRQEKFQMWYTIVTSPSAYFRPRKDVVGIPSEMSCTCPNDSFIYVTQTTPRYHAICVRCPENGIFENTPEGRTCICPENTYLIINQVNSTYLSECLECPMNSMSQKGRSEICPCEEGFARSELNNASLPCEGCFATPPTNITVITSQRPEIGITWDAPANSERWSVLYIVTVSDGSSNVTQVMESTVGTVTFGNLILQSNYTLSVTAFTETGCETGPTSVDITVMERCPDTPPNITNLVVVEETAQLEYTPPYTEDPLINESDFRYAVYLKCGFDSDFILVEDGIQNTMYIISNLQEETECTAMLVAYSNDCSRELGGRFSANIVFTTGLLECFTTPPTDLIVISSQRPEIEIAWEAPANSERWSVLYRVTVSDSRSGAIIAINGSNETTATIQNLTVFTTYTLYVTAFTETGCVTGPTSVEIMVMERCPDTPPNITNVVVSAESAQLEYTPPYTEDPLIEESDFRYAVYRKCSFDSNSSLIEDGIRNTTYIIYNLQEVTECTVMLVAYSNDCPIIFRDQYSISTTFTTEALECFTTPPTNITVISSQRPDIDITWDAPANTERRTVLYRVTVSDGTSNVTAVSSIDVTVATLPNLDVLTKYTLYVIAFTETGCETGPTSVDITVMDRCPDTPPNITNVVVSAESAQLEYTPPYTEDPLIEESDFRYAVYLKCGSDSDFILVEDGTPATTYTISDLQEVTECTAMLVAYSNDCPRTLGGPYSINTSFTTGALECFTTPPTNITVISFQRPEIGITWEAPANTERRTVLYRVTVSDGTSNVTAVSSIDVTVAILPNLAVLTNYTLYVTAFTETGCETGPTSVDITVMERCPDTPPLIINVVVSAETAQLEYTPPYTEDPLIEESDFRYAVYRKCGSDSDFILVENGTQATTYTISGLPEVTECTAMLVAYSNDCRRMLGGQFSTSTNFTTTSSVCLRENKTTSGISLTWPKTPAGEISILSCPNTDGNATRKCSVEGVWEQPYVRECFTCPLETNTTSGVTLTWPLTPVGETAVQPCPNTDRSATRDCSAEGVWEQAYIRECLTCPQETNTTSDSGVTLTWPPTIAGETAVLSCPNTDRNATRSCTVGGVWEQPYVRNCFTCPLETNTTSGVTLTWPLTPAGETLVLSCPNTDRSASRKCSAEGVWEQPYIQECLTCPQETNTLSGVTLTWPPTIAGETSVLSCPNTDGNATRNCSVEGVWEQPFICDCLTQGISQQLCNNPGDTVSVLMNISISNGDVTTEDVKAITKTLESVISDSNNLQSSESRQALIDVVEELVNVEREESGFEQIVTDSLNALVNNTPVDRGQTVTIRGSERIVEITVTHPTVDTLRDNGVEVESRGTTVNLPPGLVMQIFGSDLGGGNAKASVTTFSYDDGAFQPQDPSTSLGTNLVDISLLGETGIVPVSRLDRDNRVMFQLQRKLFTGETQICSFWDVTVSDWSSDGCEVISVTGNSVTCACDHLTIFGSLVQTLSPSTTPTISTLSAALIAVGVIVVVLLILAGVVTLGVICCYYYQKKKKKVSDTNKESGSENVALSTIRENFYVVKD